MLTWLSEILFFAQECQLDSTDKYDLNQNSVPKTFHFVIGTCRSPRELTLRKINQTP